MLSKRYESTEVDREFDLPAKVKGSISVRKDDNNTQVENVGCSPESTSTETAVTTASQNSSTFNCPEPGCVKVYTSFRALENHVIVGIYDIRLQKESVYDTIRKQWTELCNSVVIIQMKNIDAIFTGTTGTTETIHMGFGLKKMRKVRRFPLQIRNFLIEKFTEGERSGEK